MKLDADAPLNPRLLDDIDGLQSGRAAAGDSQMEGVMTMKPRKLSQKQRKSEQLRKLNP